MAEFLLEHQVLAFMILALCVVGLVALIKWPTKKKLAKIKNEKVRKALTSLFTVLATGIGVGAAGIYSWLTKTPLDLDMCVNLGNMGLGTYSYFEIIKRWAVYLFDCFKKKKKPTMDEALEIVDDAKLPLTEEEQEQKDELDSKIEDFEKHLTK